jgi:hypothetical protein
MKKEIIYKHGEWYGKLTYSKKGIHTIVNFGKSKSKDVIVSRINKYKTK